MLLRPMGDQQALVIGATVAWTAWQLLNVRTGWPLLSEVACSIAQVLLLWPILVSQNTCKDQIKPSTSRKGSPRPDPRHKPSYDPRADLELPPASYTPERELTAVKPPVTKFVRASIPMRGNTWTPKAPSAVAGTCSHSGSNNGSSGGPAGQGSTTAATQTGRNTSGAGDSSVNSVVGQVIGNRAGGSDDSDDGDGGRHPRQHELATSHSLDVTAPMAEEIASAIAAAAAASDNDSGAGHAIASSKDESSALAGKAQHDPTHPASSTAISQQTTDAAASLTQHNYPASTKPTTAAQHTYSTRPWPLQSPFAAAGSPFGSSSSSSINSIGSRQHSKDALAPGSEAAPVQQPFTVAEAAALQPVVANSSTAVAATSKPDSLVATGVTVPSLITAAPTPAPAPAAKGTTGPWRLPSPFAAPGSPFSSWSGSSKSGGSSSSSGSSKCKSKSKAADKAVAATAANAQSSATPAGKTTTGPWKLLSPFAGGGSPFSSASGRSSRSQRSSTRKEPSVPADAAGADAASTAAVDGPRSPTPDTTGHWKLSSPFAGADTPFGSNSSRNSKDPAHKSPKQKSTAADVQQFEDSSKPTSVGQSTVPGSSTTAVQGSTPAAAAAVTGPWKLASPFAAPLPAFSVAQEQQQDVPTAAGNMVTSSASASKARHSKSHKHSGGAAAAVPMKEPRHAKKSHVQSTYSASKQHGNTSKQLGNMSSKGARYPTGHQVTSTPTCVTGPWALHSPFAAAAIPASDQAPSSSSAAADPFGSPIVDQFTDSDVRTKATATAAAAAPRSAAEATSAVIAGVAVQSTDASFDAWTANSRAARPPAHTATASASTQDTRSAPAAQPTGPWQLYSPFAAAAVLTTARADGSDGKPAAAAPAMVQAVQSERSDSTGSNSASSSVRCTSPVKQAAAAAAGGVSTSSNASGMGGSNSSSTDSLAGKNKPPSIAAASEPQYSIPFSFPTTAGSGSNAATAPTLSSAATAALHDLLELDVQHMDASAESVLWPEGGLSPVPSSDAEMVLSPAHEHILQKQQQQQKKKNGAAGESAAAVTVTDSKATGATQLQAHLQHHFGSPPGLIGSQRQHPHLPSIAVARAKHLHDSVNSHLMTQHKQLAAPTVAATVQQGVPAAAATPVTAAIPASPSGLESPAVKAQHGAVTWGVLPTTTAVLPAVQAATLASQAVPRVAAPAMTAATLAAPTPVAAPVRAAPQPGAVGPAPTASMYATAPVSFFVAPVAATGGSPTPLVCAVPAATAAAMPTQCTAAAAAAAAVPGVVTPNQASSRSVQSSSGTATPTLSPRAAAVAGASAPSSPRISLQLAAEGVAALPRPAPLSCLCCYPPCLTEGMATEAHVYVLLGPEQQQRAGQQLSSSHAGGIGMDTYRVVAMFGSVVVADVRNVWRPQEGLLRVPLPALPKGAVRMAVALNDQPISFVQTLLVLPAPCAQEMVLLWASLLQTRLAAAAQLQQQQQRAATAATQPGTSASAPQQQGDASPPPRGSMDLSGSSEGAGSAWTSQGSAASTVDSGSNALPAGQAGSTTAAAACSTAHSTAAFNYQAAVADARRGGQNSAAVSPADVQAVWHKQYMPVLTDISYLLSPHPQKTAALGAGAASRQASPTAAAAAGLGSPRTSLASGVSSAFGSAGHAQMQADSPEFKSMVTQLVQFLAANGMWAVLQLITDSVYGVGASAKALYTAKAAAGPAGPLTTVSGTPNGTPGGSDAAGSGRGSLGSAGSGQVPGASAPGASRQHSSPQTGSDSIGAVPGGSTASSDRSGYSARQHQRQRQLAAAEAVGAATTAVQAGQVPELGSVFVLFTLVLKLHLQRLFANVGAYVRRAVGYVRQFDMLSAVGGVLGNGLMWFAVGVVWLGELLTEKVLQPLLRSNSGS